MNCAFSTIMVLRCDIIIETAIELRQMKIFPICLRLQRGKHLRFKTSSIKISSWRFYFSVSITPIWRLVVQNVTHLCTVLRLLARKETIQLCTSSIPRLIKCDMFFWIYIVHFLLQLFFFALCMCTHTKLHASLWLAYDFSRQHAAYVYAITVYVIIVYC